MICQAFFEKNKNIFFKKGDVAWQKWFERAESLGVNDVVKVYNVARKRCNAK